MTRGGTHQQGFALLIVLWTLALLALLGSQILAGARQDAQLARNLLDAAEVEAAANGAIQQAIFRILDRTNRHWSPGSAARTLRIGRALVTVRIEDEADKINPNIASAALLQALLLQVGGDSTTATAMAAAIIEWRLASGGPGRSSRILARYAAAGRDYAPSGAPFASVDELAAVFGMTPDLLALLRPHLTVFTDDGPSTATRDQVVAHALELARQSDTPVEPSSAALVSVIVDAQAPSHAHHIARAIVRTNARPEGRRYDILAYERLLNDQP